MRAIQSWKWLVIFTAVLFAGCVSSPDYDEDSYDPTQDYVEDDGNKIKHTIGNPAVIDLWNQAEEARQSSDFDTAELLLERALRIEPNDAVMWSRLAEVHLNQQNANQAENLAAKSNTMSVDNPTLNYRNWLIISEARKLKGDDIGAQEALYTANSFKP